MITKSIVFFIILILSAGITGVTGQEIILPDNQKSHIDGPVFIKTSSGDIGQPVLVYRAYNEAGGVNTSYSRGGIIPALFEGNVSERPPEFRNWESGDKPPGSDEPETNIPLFLRVLISTGMMVAILILVVLIGLRIGTSYRYEYSEQTQKWIGVGHVISALLIAVPIWIIYTIQTDTADQYFLATMYALIGVLIYLLLSSLVQAVSIFKGRPIPPVNHIHILFVFIAISLILMGRVPFFPPLPNTILAISVMFLPGAVLSLLSGQIIKQVPIIAGGDPGVTLTHPQSFIRTELTSSFPDALHSRYRDISIIGSGGVAVVYRAIRVRDGLQVALKIPFSPDETSGRTFLNEMAIWRDLHHPCIVEVFDQNIFPVPYVEMEYISRSLRDITYPVAPDRAISIVRDISSALSYAHGAGVIHRDIKPGNVLLTEQGRAKLTDWGLSRSLYRADETKNTSFSLYYATPEQLAPDMYGNGDQRTDIYQLGVLLYELICGEPPYIKAGIGEIFMAIQKNSYRLPSVCNESFSRFDPIITKSLKANPSERFSSIEEFSTCLDQIMQDRM